MRDKEFLKTDLIIAIRAPLFWLRLGAIIYSNLIQLIFLIYFVEENLLLSIQFSKTNMSSNVEHMSFFLFYNVFVEVSPSHRTKEEPNGQDKRSTPGRPDCDFHWFL